MSDTATESEEQNYAYHRKTLAGKNPRARLADEITRDIMNVLHYPEESVSVAFEEVKPEDWAGKVYQADILSSPEKLYKKPGYTM